MSRGSAQGFVIRAGRLGHGGRAHRREEILADLNRLRADHACDDLAGAAHAPDRGGEQVSGGGGRQQIVVHVRRDDGVEFFAPGGQHAVGLGAGLARRDVQDVGHEDLSPRVRLAPLVGDLGGNVVDRVAKDRTHGGVNIEPESLGCGVTTRELAAAEAASDLGQVGIEQVRERPGGGGRRQPPRRRCADGGRSCAQRRGEVDGRRGGVVVGDIGELVEGVRLAYVGAREFLEVFAQRAPRATRRARDDAAPLLPLGCEREPVAQFGNGLIGQHALVGAGVGDDEQRYVAKARLGEAIHEVGAHVGKDLRRDPVEDDRELQAALMRVAQVLPRDRIAVARGSRDKQPQVGGLEEFRRGFAVQVVEGVEVGSVDEGQALGQRLVADGRRAVGERDVRNRCLRMVNENALARRGSQDSGLGDFLAQDRVQQRGFARARRAAEYGNHGDVFATGARQQVRVDLGEHAGTQNLGIVDVRGRKYERRALEIIVDGCEQTRQRGYPG
ncbi:hypothetical protein BSZ39_03680 [Bowdeniella nasicola]|uniref:Uncharacterized protein n=1 Tax=Bowdeniella nasicola TaxID=208480 RepID=A0A1Q5Q3T1_9ACTO|nr:hypothetical protein BSZ39_03680 [Bowdeniella nasicola]